MAVISVEYSYKTDSGEKNGVSCIKGFVETFDRNMFSHFIKTTRSTNSVKILSVTQHSNNQLE